MPYDAKKFKKLQAERLAKVKPYRKPKRIHDGWRELAGSIIYQAIMDWRAIMQDREPPGSKDLGILPWDSHEQELRAYFQGDEFLTHCALVGVSASKVLDHVGISVPSIIFFEL